MKVLMYFRCANGFLAPLPSLFICDTLLGPLLTPLMEIFGARNCEGGDLKKNIFGSKPFLETYSTFIFSLIKTLKNQPQFILSFEQIYLFLWNSLRVKCMSIYPMNISYFKIESLYSPIPTPSSYNAPK